jgi:hypothetical protein
MQRRLVVSYRRFWKTYQSYLQGSSSPGPLTFKDGTDRLSRNVGNCQSTVRDVREERSHLHCGGSMKSHIVSEINGMCILKDVPVFVVVRSAVSVRSDEV